MRSAVSELMPFASTFVLLLVFLFCLAGRNIPGFEEFFSSTAFSGRHFLGVGYTAACTERFVCRTAYETVRVLVAYHVRRTVARVGLTKVR